MEHSSRQAQREQEYARKNKEYLEEKRNDLASLKQQTPEEPIVRKKRSTKTYCCIPILILIVLASGLIYYFITNVKDALYQDWLNKKEQLQGVLPQGTEEIKKSLDQGQDLLDQTTTTAGELKTKYEKAQDLYQKGQNTIEQLQDVKTKVEDVIN